jgi:hypothetical protein
MCDFFSFVSDPSKPIPERFMFMNWATRKQILAGKLNYEPDSHTSIIHFHGYRAAQEDHLNKYEFIPLTGKFKVDQINHKTDDSVTAEKWVKRLDFKKVVEPLIIKPIIHPLKISSPRITQEIIDTVRQWDSVWASVRNSVWASVWDSVGDSVWDSVGDSVCDSVRNSVWDSVGDSVWDSVRNSVRNSVGDSVWDSVGDSVGDSVWDSVWAYISSFFNVEYEYNFSPAVKLWELGLIPSFDGKTWRLHGGETAEILWEDTL